MCCALVTLTDDRKRRLQRVFRNSLLDARMTLDQGAREAEKDVRQYARQLSGEERGLDAITKQPDTYLRELGLNLLVEFGIPKRARLAAKLRTFTIGTRRQLRITARNAERTA